MANLVPVVALEDALENIGAHSQTVAIFPEHLKDVLRHRLALRGVQRIVSLGGVAELHSGAAPHDGMEPLRRMCRWIVEEPALGLRVTPGQLVLEVNEKPAT